MRSTHLRDGLSGALAAGLGLGASELAAGSIAGVPSLIEGLGNLVIDNVPPPVKDWAIATFGTNDKVALLVGIVVVALLAGAAVGVVARRRFGIAVLVFGVVGGLAGVVATLDPQVSAVGAATASTTSVSVGLAALWGLYRLDDVGVDGSTDRSRRGFILGAGAVFGVAVTAGMLGRTLLERAKRAVAGREEVVLPGPAAALPPVPAAAELGVDGLERILVANDDFFRIDTAISVPRVDLETWSLRFTGMVDRPYSIDFVDLLDMRMVERDVTLACVSNPVGGELVGTARWLGVPLHELLARADAHAGAEQLVGRSVDGFTVGFPVEAAYDGREALVAVGMNGEPLPFEHGFPARLVVAGLYGYVSATKWLTEMELTGWDDFDAYWIPRGWAKEAPIKTQSRVDTPADGAVLSAGRHVVAGVAWAPTKGIARVEVQLGVDAPWLDAELSESLSENAWVQWKVEWEASTEGAHVLTCRATDGTGYVQTDQLRPPAPDGATGWHSHTVTVSG